MNFRSFIQLENSCFHLLHFSCYINDFLMVDIIYQLNIYFLQSRISYFFLRFIYDSPVWYRSKIKKELLKKELLKKAFGQYHYCQLQQCQCFDTFSQIKETDDSQK